MFRKVFTGLLAALAVAISIASAAQARCNPDRLVRFLKQQAFELPATDKIDLYADRVLRYYDDRNLTRQEVLRRMQAWEARWPERIYKFLRMTDFQETESGDACRVSIAYRFLAYRPKDDKISAGLGALSLVLADIDGNGRYKIVGEYGRVTCRGLKRFARSRC